MIGGIPALAGLSVLQGWSHPGPLVAIAGLNAIFVFGMALVLVMNLIV